MDQPIWISPIIQSNFSGNVSANTWNSILILDWCIHISSQLTCWRSTCQIPPYSKAFGYHHIAVVSQVYGHAACAAGGWHNTHHRIEVNRFSPWTNPYGLSLFSDVQSIFLGNIRALGIPTTSLSLRSRFDFPSISTQALWQILTNADWQGYWEDNWATNYPFVLILHLQLHIWFKSQFWKAKIGNGKTYMNSGKFTMCDNRLVTFSE